MKKLLSLVFMLFLGLVTFAATSNEQAREALEFFGLSPFWAGTIVSVFGVLITQFFPNKYASFTYHIEALLHWFNEKTNRETEKQKLQRLNNETKIKYSGIKRTFYTLLTLLLLSGPMYAQSAWDGFFKPVDEIYQPTQLKSTGESAEWLFRPSVALVANAIDFSSKDPLSISLNSFGMGISYGKYTIVDDKPYCTYSFNGMLLTTIDIGGVTATQMGAALTVDVFDKRIGAGIGFINKSFMLLIPLSYSF